MQVIAYEEYLPALLGRNAIARYQGYQPTVDASIATLFSAAVSRYGHRALSSDLLRLNAQGDSIVTGNLALRGLASQVCQPLTHS